MNNTLTPVFQSKNALLSIAAIFFDRIAYYGSRSILILYFIDKLQFDQNTILELYGYTNMVPAIFAIIGAIIGDLTSNKIVSIVSFIGMILSCLAFAIPSEITAIIGAFAFLIFSKNNSVHMRSIFARELQPSKSSLDTGFTIFYVVINIAAFMGSIIVGLLAEKFSFILGFAFCVIVYMLGCLAVFLLTPKNTSSVHRMKSSLEIRWLIPILVGIFISTFWILYEVCFSNTYLIFSDMIADQEQSNFSMYGLSVIQLAPIVLFGFILIILWAFLKMNSFLKKAIGFTLAAFAVLLMMFIPEQADSTHMITFIAAMSIIGLAELIIGPIGDSIIARYVHPKWLATAFAILYFVFALGSYIASFVKEHIVPIENEIALIIGIVIFLIMGIGCLLLAIFLKSGSRPEVISNAPLDNLNSLENDSKN